MSLLSPSLSRLVVCPCFDFLSLLFQKDEDGKEAKPAAQQQDKVLFTLVNGQVGFLIWRSLSLLVQAITVKLVR